MFSHEDIRAIKVYREDIVNSINWFYEEKDVRMFSGRPIYRRLIAK